MRTLRRLLLPLALAGALLAACAPGASAAEKSIWGPTGNFSGCGGSCFPLYAQLGVDNVQFQIPWDTVARSRPANPQDPNDPAYRWPSYADFMVSQAAQHGISLTALVQGTPPWANGGKSRAWVPDNVQDYANFMVAISRRYPSIHRWMIWGEVNYGANFQPMPAHSPEGPRAYARLLDAAYGALKGADPNNIVIGGNTLNVDAPVSLPEFIQWLRIGEGKTAYPPRVDWFGHNPFEGRIPNLDYDSVGSNIGLSDADTMHTLLKRAYVGKKKKKRKRKKARRSAQVPNSAAHVAKKKCKKRKRRASASAKKKGKKCKRIRRSTPPIWFSEYTVLSGHGAHFWGGFHVSDQEQAAWLTAAYRLINSVHYVKGLGWYRLDDEPEAAGSANWGLIRFNGERKPSFAAYQAAP